jgi:hypothetical protein
MDKPLTNKPLTNKPLTNKHGVEQVSDTDE